jgi:hypothetical protein
VLWGQKDGASSPFIGSDREEKAGQGGEWWPVKWRLTPIVFSSTECGREVCSGAMCGGAPENRQ